MDKTKENDKEMFFQRAVDHAKQGRFMEALADYDRVIGLDPRDFAAHSNRGNALTELGHFAEALASFERAIAIKSNLAFLHYNQGVVLERLGRMEEALASYEHALALSPDYAAAHCNRGAMFGALGRHVEAVRDLERSIVLKPTAVAFNNLGFSLLSLGRREEALRGFEHALALDPQYIYASYNRAVLQLASGNYQDGFKNYESRLMRPDNPLPRRFAQPQWRGEPIDGKTILLHVEQGLGDSIQMLRYLPMLKARAAHVLLELQPALVPLLGPMAAGLTVLKTGQVIPPFDVYCPMMSLPLAFGARVDAIPAHAPYLTIPQERIPQWRERLPSGAVPRIGLVWSSGSLGPGKGRNRSIALELLAPLLAVPGLGFVSLQREYRDHDPPALARLPIERIDEGLADFADTAAAIAQCDLVISVDTSVAHLAGALGKPVWILLPYVADWRWLLDRSDSPWYPSARLFRQSQVGDWEGLIREVAKELSRYRAAFLRA